MSLMNLRNAAGYVLGLVHLKSPRKPDLLREDFLDAARQCNLNKIAECLRRGVNPNCFQVDDGFTALHIAAERGDIPLILKLLTCRDIKIDSRTYRGNTPLHVACQSEKLRVVKVLLKNGADPNARDTFSKTSLHMAVVCDSIGIVQTLCKYKVNINAVDVMANTPLHLAALVRYFLPMVKFLLIHGADPNIATGNMPLFLECVLSCHQDLQLEVTLFLIQQGVDINTTDKIAKKNALHYVALTGYVPLAAQLLQMGCNPFARDLMGRLPIDMAILHENEEVEILLEEFMYPSSDDYGEEVNSLTKLVGG